MHSTLTCRELVDPAALERLRDDYLRALVAPMDGMWESAVIARATFWEICDQERRAGHFCLGADGELLRFHVVEPYQAQAQEIFQWVVATQGIQQAIASTIEPLYFPLCLDLQSSIRLDGYLFRDHRRIEGTSGLDVSGFRKAARSELADLMRFYQANTEGPGEWIEAFLRERLDREEIYVLSERRTVIATGECIPSQRQPPYVDLGMVVARAHRGKGLGSAMLIQLKRECYAAGLKPICSCDASNHASKKAIERAGFISEHRRVSVRFSQEALADAQTTSNQGS